MTEPDAELVDLNRRVLGLDPCPTWCMDPADHDLGGLRPRDARTHSGPTFGTLDVYWSEGCSHGWVAIERGDSLEDQEQETAAELAVILRSRAADLLAAAEWLDGAQG